MTGQEVDVQGAIEAVEQAKLAFETALDTSCTCSDYDAFNCVGCREGRRAWELLVKALFLLGADKH